MSDEAAPPQTKGGRAYVALAVKVAVAAVLLAGAFYVGGNYRDWKLFDSGTLTGETKPDDQAQQPPVQKPNFPRMKLEAIYAGPFQDTIIQRWRDPIDGRICYIYLPVRVKHQPPEKGGLVDYGSSAIGSISCGGPPNPPPPAKQ